MLELIVLVVRAIVAGCGGHHDPVLENIARGDVLDTVEHPNQARYGGQRIFVVKVDDYVYLVPFVEDDTSVFLKTIIPSRKATKQYLGEEPEDDQT